MKIINGKEISDELWDSFVAECPNGSIEQTRAWAQFQKKVPGRDFVGSWAVVSGANDTILAVVQVFSYETGFAKKKWAYSPRGPVGLDPKSIDWLIKTVKTYLQKEKYMYWRLDPAWSADFYAHFSLKNAETTR